MMKLASFLPHLALLTLGAAAANSALAEDCSVSYYCYGNYLSFSRVDVQVSEDSSAMSAVPVPRPSNATQAQPTNVRIPPVLTTSPQSIPVRTPANATGRHATVANRGNSCQITYQSQLEKASALDALARTQMQRGKEDQAKRLFATAAQLRASVAHLNCVRA